MEQWLTQKMTFC